MSSRNNSRRRLLSKDERVLWNSFTRAIAPLRTKSGAAPENDDAVAEITSQFRPKRPMTVPAPEPVKPVPPSLTPLGRRLRQRVARGREAIDARLDLHGLTQSQAHSALLHFLRAASAREARLVLVITGKGGRGDGERGVLRRLVPHWLTLPEFRSFVIGFEDAHIAHGGEGALYVRIRRNKSR